VLSAPHCALSVFLTEVAPNVVLVLLEEQLGDGLDALLAAWQSGLVHGLEHQIAALAEAWEICWRAFRLCQLQ